MSKKPTVADDQEEQMAYFILATKIKMLNALSNKMVTSADMRRMAIS